MPWEKWPLTRTDRIVSRSTEDAPALERLAEALRSDPGLRAELSRCEHPDSAVRLAAARGFSLTFEEARELVRSLAEPLADELDQVAAGAWNDPAAGQ